VGHCVQQPVFFRDLRHPPDVEVEAGAGHP
jgi:hypothetical protein